MTPGLRGAAIERLLDDEESERLGAGAYRTWEQHFTPEIALRNLEETYEAAIEVARRGR